MYCKQTYQFFAADFEKTFTNAIETFRGNSVYDPRFATDIQGISASNFDFWSSRYWRYTVLGSSIRVQGKVASVHGPMRVMVQPNMDVPDLTHNNFSAVPGPYRYKTTPYFMTVGTPNSGVTHSLKSINMKMYASTASIWNCSASHVANDVAFSGSGTSNPSNQWYWNLWFVPATQGPWLVTSMLTITIKYYVKWWRPKNIYQRPDVGLEDVDPREFDDMEHATAEEAEEDLGPPSPGHTPSPPPP